jgi:putative Mn2+ efflux pump MntP
MAWWLLLGIAVGPAMDAFAAAIAVSVGLGRVSRRQTFRLAWHFGLFQALMPVLGWYGGMSVERWIKAWDHWLAFGLLVFVGGRMLASGLRRGRDDAAQLDPTRGLSLLLSNRPASQAAGFRTNLAYFNPNSFSVDVTLDAWTAGGDMMGSDTLTLAPYSNLGRVAPVTRFFLFLLPTCLPARMEARSGGLPTTWDLDRDRLPTRESAPVRSEAWSRTRKSARETADARPARRSG